MAGSSSSKKSQCVAYKRQFVQRAIEADLMDVTPPYCQRVSEKCIWLAEHGIVDMVNYKGALLCDGFSLELPECAFSRERIIMDLPDICLEIGWSFFNSTFQPKIITDGWRTAFVHGVTHNGDLLMFAPFNPLDLGPDDLASKHADSSLAIAHILDITGGTRLHIIICSISEAIVLPYDVDIEEKLEARKLAEGLLMAWSPNDG